MVEMKNVREVTIGTFSWCQGTSHPTVGMVSLGKDDLQVHACMIPFQLNLFLYYVVLFIVTAPILLFHGLFLCLNDHPSRWFWRNHKLEDLESQNQNDDDSFREIGFPKRMRMEQGVISSRKYKTSIIVIDENTNMKPTINTTIISGTTVTQRWFCNIIGPWFPFLITVIVGVTCYLSCLLFWLTM